MAAERVLGEVLHGDRKPAPPRGSLRGVARSVLKDRLALLGASVILFFTLVAVLAPVLEPYNPARMFSQSVGDTLAHLPPLWMGGRDPRYPFGTDRFGYDMLTELIFYTRHTMEMGFSAVAALTGVGLLLGLLSGWLGGAWDDLIMRLADVTDSVPAILGYILVGVLLSYSFPRLDFLLVEIVAFSSVGWAYTARLVRGQVLSIKGQEFVIAARSVGVSTPRLLARHILPNCLGMVLVVASYQLPLVIVASGFLSSTGIGVGESGLAGLVFQEWGQMAFAPEFVLMPTIGIVAISLAFTALGDGLQKAMNPMG